MKRYREAFDPIEVPDDMAARILARAERTPRTASQPHRRFTSVLVAACLLLAVGLTAMGALLSASREPGVQLVNPYADMADLEELQKELPFVLQLPGELPAGYVLDRCSVVAGTLAQLVFGDGTAEICYRMAEGEQDISGDYNQYERTYEQRAGDVTLTLKSSQDLVRLATWSGDGYSFSLSFSEGIDEQTALAIVKSVR
ncbi:hypothetical protein [Feifania hominis]|uniref:DUF4367 domain-containing protein n=1 Tax=Feifania hominis TaxID=2763660 RepID=A0A926DDF2_9FIRM|nr:hypothetical protein [Feifania hominis]MBC8535274.1 hypothetical protein [Feifania hominis]